MDIVYDEDSRSVRCISTGSPATVVSWMKDGVIIDESSTDYTLRQTITNRATSTYNNIVTVNEGAPGGIAGTYICTVTNDIGTATDQTVAVGELMVNIRISATYYISHYISGITVTGLENPLIVGQSAATISCMTNIAVNSIEWRNESSQLIINDAGNLMELQYTIDLVTDDLHGQQFTCIAIADTTIYNETVIIQVQGITILWYNDDDDDDIHVYTHFISLVPDDALYVMVEASVTGPVLAGSEDLTLTCTVNEAVMGLTNIPSAQWMKITGLVTSGNDDITITETVIDDSMTIVTLSFISLHTSHAGQYMCQGILDSPATLDDIITSIPANVTVNVICKYLVLLCSI